MKTLIFTITILATGMAYGDTYKCVDDGGHTTFSFMPCPAKPSVDPVVAELAAATRRHERIRAIEARLYELESHIQHARKERMLALLQVEQQYESAHLINEQQNVIRNRFSLIIEEDLNEISQLRQERLLISD